MGKVCTHVRIIPAGTMGTFEIFSKHVILSMPPVWPHQSLCIQ